MIVSFHIELNSFKTNFKILGKDNIKVQQVKYS